VRHVVNITDVGHLTSDADAGEDKMEKGSRRTGRTAWDIAAFYTDAFQRDLERLRILPPTVWARATDHIPEQIAFIADIERAGFSYRPRTASTSTPRAWSATATWPGSTSRAARRPPRRSRRQALADRLRAVEVQRRGTKANGVGQPWGRGFPGWHIECSAMSTRYLGALFDIHIGGEDHVPVHHSNEIAQHEACHGHPPARYWLHGSFLRLADSDKMSKSDGSFIRLETLVERGFDPLAYRYLVLTAHYRSKLVFSWEALEAAQTALGRLRRAYHELPAGGAADPAYRERMLAELNDDLNTPRALALAWEVLKSGMPGAKCRRRRWAGWTGCSGWAWMHGGRRPMRCRMPCANWSTRASWPVLENAGPMRMPCGWRSRRPASACAIRRRGRWRSRPALEFRSASSAGGVPDTSR
jgi:cysteinyl-tRNA synthetase